MIFPNSERKRKPIHVPIFKKIHRLERAQYAFLDHSKTLVSSDVIKISNLFEYSRARAYSSRAKKLCKATLNGNQLLLSYHSGSALYTVTLTALLEATNNWSVDIDDGLLNDVVFIDLTNATTDHKIISR